MTGNAVFDYVSAISRLKNIALFFFLIYARACARACDCGYLSRYAGKEKRATFCVCTKATGGAVA